MILQLSDILPNPFRNLVLNPIVPEKVQEMVSSFEDTGFWKNVVVRPSPAQKGKYELAYGHHRLEAARLHNMVEHDFAIENLSDDLMLKIMDRENRKEWGNNILLTTIESLTAAVKLLEAGKLHPYKDTRTAFEHKKDVKKSALMCAPSFVPGKTPPTEGSSVGRLFTASDIARYLGRLYEHAETKVADEVRAAFYILQVEELGDKDPLGKPWSVKTHSLWSVHDVLGAAKTRSVKALVRTIEAERNLKVQKAEGKGIQARIDEKLVEQQRIDDEIQAQADKILETRRAKIEAKAKKEKERLAELEKKEKEEKAKKEEEKLQARKQQQDLLKLKKKTDKKVEKAEENLEEARKEQERRRAQQWIGTYKTILEKLGNILSDGDPLYTSILRFRENELATEEQRARIQLALRDVATRAASISPFATAPSSKQDEATKQLKSKGKK